MKKFIVTSFTVLALLFSLANCGKSGSGSNNNPNTYYPYNPNYTTPNQYNQQYQQMYGGNYNYCNQYATGCTSCYYPQCSNGGCTWGQVYYAQPGYYAPQYGMYGQGGAFSMAIAW
ncbi:MAG: hypothetical protein R3A80_12840 [Bdellovibrionota bacterium]